MSGMGQYQEINWRTPNEGDLKKLASVKKSNKVAAFIITAIVIVLLCVAGVIFRNALISNSGYIGYILPIVIIIFAIILATKIHFVPKYEVADVIVEEIIMDRSFDTGNIYTANVSQGDVLVERVNIYSKKNPEIGSTVLMYMENKDSMSVGII